VTRPIRPHPEVVVHECGHAVAAVAVGLRHGDLSALPAPDGSLGRLDGLPRDRALLDILADIADVPPVQRWIGERHVIAGMAGDCAVQLWLDRPADTWARDNDTQVLRLVELMYPQDVDAIVAQLWERTRNLLLIPACWRAVMLLAHALYRAGGVLAPDAVGDIVRGAVGERCGRLWPGLGPCPLSHLVPLDGLYRDST